jgi:hypothetical protein
VNLLAQGQGFLVSGFLLQGGCPTCKQEGARILLPIVLVAPQGALDRHHGEAGIHRLPVLLPLALLPQSQQFFGARQCLLELTRRLQLVDPFLEFLGLAGIVALQQALPRRLRRNSVCWAGSRRSE